MSDDDAVGHSRKTIRDIELTLAEWVGKDGDGGRLRTLEKKVEHHDTVLDSLKTFKVQVLAIVAVAGAVAGLAATFISKLL